MKYAAERAKKKAKGRKATKHEGLSYDPSLSQRKNRALRKNASKGKTVAIVLFLCLASLSLPAQEWAEVGTVNNASGETLVTYKGNNSLLLDVFFKNTVKGRRIYAIRFYGERITQALCNRLMAYVGKPMLPTTYRQDTSVSTWQTKDGWYARLSDKGLQYNRSIP